MIDYLMECKSDTREKAELKSLEILQLTPEDVDFEVVNSAGGLKRLFKSTPLLLRTFLKKERTIPSEKIARGIVYTLLHKMGVDIEIESMTKEEDNIVLALQSPTSALLIGKHGRNLDALQFLVNLLVSRWDRKHTRIILEVSNYRKKRKESIESLCQTVAERVMKKGRPIMLNHMSPYERRIVHLFLEDDERVYTESVGDGVYKRVKIFPQGYHGNKDGQPNEETESLPEMDDTLYHPDDSYENVSSEELASIQKKHAEQASQEEREQD